MHFCSNCHNMYYLKIRDDDEGKNSLIYYCRNCGDENTTLTAENICVSETQLRRSEQKFTHMVNEYTKYDPTLPRINSIKCPNQECISNTQSGGATKKTTAATSKKPMIKIKSKTTKKDDKTEQSEEPEEQFEEQASVSKEQASVLKEQASVSKEQASVLKEQASVLKEQASVLKEQASAQSEILAKESLNISPTNNREVIYIRYDDINMKYVYLCVHCDTTWKTDNRI
jgi:hypothetical protein